MGCQVSSLTVIVRSAFWSLVCASLALGQSSAAVLTARWTGGSDLQWTNAANWDISKVPNNNGIDIYNVVWDSHPGTIISDASVTVQNLTMSVDGDLGGAGDLTIQGDFLWHLGTIEGTGTTTVQGLGSHDSGKINLADRAISFGLGLQVSGGELRLDGGKIQASSAITVDTAAELSGYGFVHQATIAGALNPTGGQLPSGDIAWLQFDFLDLQPTAETGFKIKGSAPGAFDKLSVNNTATLRGKLQVEVDPSAVILPSDTFEIVSAGPGATVTGHFDNVAFGQRLLTSDGVHGFTVTQTASGSVVLSQYGLFAAAPIALAMQPKTIYQFDPAATFLDTNALVLVSKPSVDWNGGILQVRFSGSPTNDTILMADDPSVDFAVHGGAVFYREIEFAKVSPSPDAPTNAYTFTFESTATLDGIQELLRRLQIAGRKPSPDSHFADTTVLITLIDSAGDRAEQTITGHFPDLVGLHSDPERLLFQTPILKPDLGLEFGPQYGSFTVHGLYSNGSLAPLKSGDVAIALGPACGGITVVPETNVTQATFDVAVSRDTSCVVSVTDGALVLHVPLLVFDQDCIFEFLFEFLTELLLEGTPASVLHVNAATSSPTNISLATFRALEGLMNQTQEGQRLTALYRTYSPELVNLALNSSSLAHAEANLVLSFQSAVTALLVGKGDQFVLTQQVVDQVNSVWDQIIAVASPALKDAMQTERNRLNGFQPFVGKPFSQWAKLLDVSVPLSPWIYISHPRRSGNGFTLQANAIGSAETLFRSAKALSGWQPVTNATQTITGDTIEFLDPAAPSGEVFYEIRSVAP